MEYLYEILSPNTSNLQYANMLLAIYRGTEKVTQLERPLPIRWATEVRERANNLTELLRRVQDDARTLRDKLQQKRESINRRLAERPSETLSRLDAKLSEKIDEIDWLLADGHEQPRRPSFYSRIAPVGDTTQNQPAGRRCNCSTVGSIGNLAQQITDILNHITIPLVPVAMDRPPTVIKQSVQLSNLKEEQTPN